MSEDQVQGSETNESVEAQESQEAQEEVKETSPDNQEAQTDDQSSKEVESKRYKLPDGREISADELYSEYAEKLLPEFTRRSQRLSEFEKAQEASKERASSEAKQAVEENDILKNVSPEVKEAIVRITEPVIEQRLAQREQQEEQVKKEQAFEEKLNTLEKKYTGSDGFPKFDRNKVLMAMKEPGNSNFDPESKFREMYFDSFVDAITKKALRKNTGTKTEKTGQQDSRQKPESEPPKNFDEAAKRLASRLQ